MAIELSHPERNQLGQVKGAIAYIPDLQAWQRFRSELVKKSARRNPGFFDPSLAAYTPGETLGLLEEPRIKAWLDTVPDIEVPADCVGVVLVPCAASKPWRNHANSRKSKLYSAYNQLIDEMEAGKRPKWFLVTVSEPCGLIPQDKWNDFPPYDNPGLFSDDFLRTGLVKSDWSKTFLGARHRLPFDQDAYEQCILRLGTQIGKFLSRVSHPVVSFVDDDAPTTHGAMLDVAMENGSIVHRHNKREQARVSPYDYLSAKLTQMEQELGVGRQRLRPRGPSR